MFVFALASILAAIWLASCRPEKPVALPPPDEFESKAPTVRVLLKSRPTREIELGTTGGYRILLDGETWREDEEPLNKAMVSRIGPGKWLIDGKTADGNVVELRPASRSLFRIGSTSYRGTLRLLQRSERELLAVNHLDLTSYLTGVLPRELYPAWEPEAYRALAVAARTFALYHMLTFGKTHDYDLGSTQAAQVYGGYTAETPKAWQAVRSTKGKVLTWGEPGVERVFMAQYSSTCGGRVNDADVLRDAPDIPPLEGGQICTDCSASSRYRWDPVSISKADVLAALRNSYPQTRLTRLDEIRVVERTSYGRPLWIEAVGTGEPLRIRVDDLRLVLLRSPIAEAKQLYSMNCRIRNGDNEIEFYDGRGFGHGVGLCQWGAQGKALRGFSGEEIVRYYYPGARIIKAY
jgi:stage II sporulation protein D